MNGQTKIKKEIQVEELVGKILDGEKERSKGLLLKLFNEAPNLIPIKRGGSLFYLGYPRWAHQVGQYLDGTGNCYSVFSFDRGVIIGYGSSGNFKLYSVEVLAHETAKGRITELATKEEELIAEAKKI